MNLVQIRNERTETNIAKMGACDISATITWTMLSINEVVHLWVYLECISSCGSITCRRLNVAPRAIVVAHVLVCLGLQLCICCTLQCMFCTFAASLSFSSSKKHGSASRTAVALTSKLLPARPALSCLGTLYCTTNPISGISIPCKDFIGFRICIIVLNNLPFQRHR